MSRILDLALSTTVSVLRGGSGLQVAPLGKRPERLLELYEFEACPFCRKVREAMSCLDIDALVKPCPKGGQRFRGELVARGGKALFPYVVDPNSGVEMYESDEIVQYLFDRYGNGSVPPLLRPPWATVGSVMAGLPRANRGVRARPSRAPERPLELWAFESSPFCRLVREVLCELELPHVHHATAKGSPRRDDFVARSGRMMVPYLVDPNTDVSMFESADIVTYLERTYAA